jgi:hypothetical protein
VEAAIRELTPLVTGKFVSAAESFGAQSVLSGVGRLRFAPVRGVGGTSRLGVFRDDWVFVF